jgi:hypothetical protein
VIRVGEEKWRCDTCRQPDVCDLEEAGGRDAKALRERDDDEVGRGAYCCEEAPEDGGVAEGDEEGGGEKAPRARPVSDDGREESDDRPAKR